MPFEQLTTKETELLHEGICPDCKGQKILFGPEGPGSVNVMCDACKMRFNKPMMRGPVGERLGKYAPDEPGVPVSIPNEGTVIQGRGRTNVSCFALHNCGHEPTEKHSGGVDLFHIGKEKSVLHCRQCGMRFVFDNRDSWVGPIKTWDDFVKAMGK